MVSCLNDFSSLECLEFALKLSSRRGRGVRIACMENIS